MPMSSKLLFNLISLNYTSNVRFQLPSIIKSHNPILHQKSLCLLGDNDRCAVGIQILILSLNSLEQAVFAIYIKAAGA